MIKITGYIDEKELENLEKWNSLIDSVMRTPEQEADKCFYQFQMTCILSGIVKASLKRDEQDRLNARFPDMVKS